MYLTALSITNFRIFSRLEVEMPRRILLLIGDNAQGKTSFLEAIHLFAALTSSQAQSDRQLINFVALKESVPVARLVAKFERNDGTHQMEIRLILETNVNGNGRLRKEILIDGVKRNLQTALGKFNAVIFLPQMMRILEGGPEERRRFLDVALAQAFPEYARVLGEFNQALSQRNALLKQLFEKKGDVEQLNYWDEIIADRGAVIIHNRLCAIHELDSIAERQHNLLSNGKENLKIVYTPSFDPLAGSTSPSKLYTPITNSKKEIDLEEIRSGFAKKLQDLRKEEISRGVTTIGPHRDDLRAFSNGIDLGIYGSRGQTRSAILSLKLAELNWLNERVGEWPVLLLDETLAELDIKHRADLLHAVCNCDQAILTTSDLHLFPNEFLSQCIMMTMQNGNIEQINN